MLHECVCNSVNDKFKILIFCMDDLLIFTIKVKAVSVVKTPNSTTATNKLKNGSF
jgi:hypothetical protein